MKQRLYDLDNLRASLTILVLLHHTAIAYGAEGSWYVIENTDAGLTPTKAVLTLFAAVNQSFFMGLFFLLAGVFTPSSFDRKGPALFLRDRLVRLGVPLLLYAFGIGPALVYAIGGRPEPTFWDFYSSQVLTLRFVNVGPLWFAEALLIMAVLYAAYRFTAARGRSVGRAQESGAKIREGRPFPTNRVIGCTALTIGLVSFTVRLVYPTGTAILGLQWGYFPSYVFWFVVGVAASRSHWIAQLEQPIAARWFRLSLLMIPVLPAGVLIGESVGLGSDVAGGWSWPAFLYAMWEPFVAVGIIFKLVETFRRKWSRTGRMRKLLADHAFTVYVIHPPVIVAIGRLLQAVPAPYVLKFLATGLASTAVCFLLSVAIRKLPYADRVL